MKKMAGAAEDHSMGKVSTCWLPAAFPNTLKSSTQVVASCEIPSKMRNFRPSRNVNESHKPGIVLSQIRLVMNVDCAWLELIVARGSYRLTISRYKVESQVSSGKILLSLCNRCNNTSRSPNIKIGGWDAQMQYDLRQPNLWNDGFSMT